MNQRMQELMREHSRFQQDCVLVQQECVLVQQAMDRRSLDADTHCFRILMGTCRFTGKPMHLSISVPPLTCGNFMSDGCPHPMVLETAIVLDGELVYPHTPQQLGYTGLEELGYNDMVERWASSTRASCPENIRLVKEEIARLQRLVFPPS